MRVAIRVDAAARMGLGHLQRCLSLARALDRVGAEVVFVTLPVDVDSVGRIRAQGFVAHALDGADDAAETVAALQARPPDWVVADHYDLDAGWHAAVAGALGARICAIDDLADRRLGAGLLVNHNPGASRNQYGGLLPEGAAVLAGPRFALLGPAYADAARYVPADTVSSIGIFMGGGDANAVLLAALRGCREVAGFGGPIEVATTTGNRGLADLQAACAAMPPTTLAIDLPDLAAFFAGHGLQLGAGGGAALERCCIGAPSVVTAWVANQRSGTAALAAQGAVLQAAPDAASLGEAVRSLLADAVLRRALSARARHLVDGLGALRVALALASERLSLRPARPDDAHHALAWRNDPRTLRHSRNPAPIALPDHLRWWDAVLADPQRRLFIASVGPVDVGTLRLDRRGSEAEISIYLDPALTGVGLGAAVLRAGQAWCAGRPRPLPIDRLVAEIDAANAASVSAFSATGFRQAADRLWHWDLPA